MQRIYFLRHGQKNNSIPGSPLTQKGIKQAEITANHFDLLNKKKELKILASPLQRTQQTAVAIAKKLDSEITTVEWLSVDYRLPRGKEGQKNFLKLIKNYQGDLLLVSHSQTIRNFLSKIFYEDHELQIKVIDADFKECSISIIDIDNEKFRLNSLAKVKHLLDLEK